MPNARAPALQLKVRLLRGSPMVWRRLRELHGVVQVAMG